VFDTSEIPMLRKFQMQSGKMAAIAMTTVLVELIIRIKADTFTLLDALQMNGYVHHNNQNINSHVCLCISDLALSNGIL
jgi:hypothetical protein